MFLKENLLWLLGDFVPFFFCLFWRPSVVSLVLSTVFLFVGLHFLRTNEEKTDEIDVQFTFCRQPYKELILLVF